MAISAGELHTTREPVTVGEVVLMRAACKPHRAVTLLGARRQADVALTCRVGTLDAIGAALARLFVARDGAEEAVLEADAVTALSSHDITLRISRAADRRSRLT